MVSLSPIALKSILENTEISLKQGKASKVQKCLAKLLTSTHCYLELCLAGATLLCSIFILPLVLCKIVINMLYEMLGQFRH